MENILENCEMKLKLGGKIPVQEIHSIMEFMKLKRTNDEEFQIDRVINHLKNILLLEFNNDSIRLYHEYCKEEMLIKQAKHFKMIKQQEKRQNKL